jgi:hypothetical protein
LKLFIPIFRVSDDVRGCQVDVSKLDVGLIKDDEVVMPSLCGPVGVDLVPT